MPPPSRLRPSVRRVRPSIGFIGAESGGFGHKIHRHSCQKDDGGTPYATSVLLWSSFPHCPLLYPAVYLDALYIRRPLSTTAATMTAGKRFRAFWKLGNLCHFMLPRHGFAKSPLFRFSGNKHVYFSDLTSHDLETANCSLSQIPNQLSNFNLESVFDPISGIESCYS